MVDASMVDASIQVPAFVVATSAANANAASLSYPLTIPQGTNRFLLVSVQIGVTCPAILAPVITSVSYAGASLTPITQILGTPCGLVTTRSAQWGLVAPAAGASNVVITLAGIGQTVHSGALAFTGINQATPVRASQTASGTGTSSTVTTSSSAGDLVVNTVGQGNSITAPGGGQTQRYVRNVNTSNTLNNSAASTAPGAAMLTMTWTFGSADEWQTISSSLRP